jgi:hypothetical protein
MNHLIFILVTGLALFFASVSARCADSMVLLRSVPPNTASPLTSSYSSSMYSTPITSLTSPRTLVLNANGFAQPTQTDTPLNGILHGIAMVESRRGNTPWPWTLNVAGKPYFFIDRESAWNASQRLTQHQIDNFDIGVMQVNWHFHKQRFKSTWDALDPKTNQNVAESILREQWERTGHLPTAIARYHSANPELGMPYLKKVMQAINEAGREK